MDTLIFYPERMALYLGMGDIQHLLKRPRNSLMKNRQKNWKKRSGGTSLILPISNNN
jgi:signal recognition particle GTPase